jgi:hypothetical protein
MAGRNRWWNLQSSQEHQTTEPGAPTYPQSSGVSSPHPRAPGQPAVTIGARSRQEIEHLRDLVRADLGKGDRTGRRWDRDELQWRQGIVDAALWALGDSSFAPVTGQTGEPDDAALRDEDFAADDIACGRRSIPGITPAYANGVQHTVMWVRGETQDSPWFQ